MSVASVVSVATSLELFFTSLSDSPHFTLMADFDGTLAPFALNRAAVNPYPGVRESLNRLIDKGVRVSIVSGRSAHEVQKMLGMPSIEVWGSHGVERLLPCGEYSAARSPQTTSCLELIVEALRREQLTSEIEVKPFGIAVHWRGVPSSEIQELRCAAIRAFQSVTVPDFGVFAFDGGMEFRSRLITKANAVRHVRQELPSASIAYLGDDHTDEDAFSALGPHDLSILVRPEYRNTAAQVWLRPPDQLLAFLDDLALAAGEKQ